MGLGANNIMNRIQKDAVILKPIGAEDSAHLKRVLVLMLKDLCEVTEKNGLTCILAYGSALGAVRHKGFIPWDDDLDVYMSRKDWELFKRIFEDEMGEKYILEGPNCNEYEAKNTFAKMYLRGTELTDIYDLNTPYFHCIYIDIFILDNISVPLKSRIIHVTC